MSVKYLPNQETYTKLKVFNINIFKFELMKRSFFVLFLYIFAFSYSIDLFPREITSLNFGWKYMRGDYNGAENPGFNDSSWEEIGIPHSFSIPYFMSKDFYVGYGWYRKRLNIEDSDLKKSIFLEFDGVFQDAEVFVNGEPVGRHIGGYTGFSLDITSAVKSGENLLAVRVNNIWRPDVAPRAGEHTFSGGIYRDVRLVTTDRIHVTWYGTSVTTPELGKNNGRSSSVVVCNEIPNGNNRDADLLVVTTIYGAEGNSIVSSEKEVLVEGNSSVNLTQKTPPVESPSLWSTDNPYLYKVSSKIYKDGNIVDSIVTPFGFRWFEWTSENGFYLNGNHVYIRGVNVHQDQAGWGDAVTAKAMSRDVEMVKEAGFNLIRGSHYPHSPFFSQACDENGIMFWSEAPFWGIGGFKSDGYWNSSAYPLDSINAVNFEESALQQLSEMIRIHRNHPSIVAWSMCNEAFFTASGTMTGVRRLLRRMVELSHRLDPTRPAAIGGSQRPLGEDRIDMIGDLAGYNGDGATQQDFQNPGIPNLVSEYGSVTSDRPGEYSPGWGDLSRNDGWKGYSWRSGHAIWCGFDHGSIAGSALGKMGIIDYFRIPKRSWYWYRNEYAGVAPPKWSYDGIPYCLEITPSSTSGILTDGSDDVHLLVRVLDKSGNLVSHSPDVELKIVSGPGEFPTGRSILFEKDSDIRIMDGQAAISVRSYYAGTTLIEAVSSGLRKASVKLEFVGENKYVEGVTPKVESREYIRFVRSENSIMTFGRNNPTFSSSIMNGHTSGMSADGDMETFWLPADNDKSPYLILDTEKRLLIDEICLYIVEAEDCGFVIEVSNDKERWSRISDYGEGEKTGEKIRFKLNHSNVSGRFVRIRSEMKGMPGISEIRVMGIVCD